MSRQRQTFTAEFKLQLVKVYKNVKSRAEEENELMRPRKKKTNA